MDDPAQFDIKRAQTAKAFALHPGDAMSLGSLMSAAANRRDAVPPAVLVTSGILRRLWADCGAPVRYRQEVLKFRLSSLLSTYRSQSESNYRYIRQAITSRVEIAAIFRDTSFMNLSGSNYSIIK